ncbi:MAG: hypothetical protein KJ051_10430 [Thermoleophilia bacterium]|nr:hypothetical protein [Thermoleophilia bacterium]
MGNPEVEISVAATHTRNHVSGDAGRALSPVRTLVFRTVRPGDHMSLHAGRRVMAGIG